jgi:hypothetical protein
MSTLTKYWDKYSKRGKTDTVPEAKKQMTDREAYISFLEVQLERVTQAVLVTQGFSDRIEQLQGQVNTVEDKVMNVTRLVKLQQNYAEGQEEELSLVKTKVERMLKEKEESLALKPKTSPEQVEIRLQRIEESLLKDQTRPKDLDDTRSDLRTMVPITQALLKDQKQRFDEQVNSLQEKFMSALERSEQRQTDSLRGIETRFSQELESVSKLDLVRTPSFSDHSRKMEDMEHLMRVLGEEFSTMRSHLDTLDGDLATVMRKRSGLKSDEAGQTDRILKLEGIVLGTAERLKDLESLQRPDIAELEKVIGKKMSKAVDRMGEVLKRYVEAQKSLHSSLVDLTTRMDRMDKNRPGRRLASPGRGKKQSQQYRLHRLEAEETRQRSHSVSEGDSVDPKPRHRSTSRSLTPKSQREKSDLSPAHIESSRTIKKSASKKPAKASRKSKLEKIYSQLKG